MGPGNEVETVQSRDNV